MCLPLHSCAQHFLSEFRLTPAQLAPNSWNVLFGSFIAWCYYGAGGDTTETPPILRSFALKVAPLKENLFFFLAKRNDRKRRAK